MCPLHDQTQSTRLGRRYSRIVNTTGSGPEAHGTQEEQTSLRAADAPRGRCHGRISALLPRPHTDTSPPLLLSPPAQLSARQPHQPKPFPRVSNSLKISGSGMSSYVHVKAQHFQETKRNRHPLGEVPTPSCSPGRLMGHSHVLPHSGAGFHAQCRLQCTQREACWCSVTPEARSC